MGDVWRYGDGEKKEREQKDLQEMREAIFQANPT